jgi:hypothetical protein
MNSISNRLLILARFTWLGITVGSWLFWLASLPGFLARTQSGSVPTAVYGGVVQVSPEIFQQAAAAWKMTVPAWAWVNALANGITLLTFGLIAWLIWARVRTWFGLLTAMVLMLGGSNAMGYAVYTAQLSATAIRLWSFGALIWPFFFLWIYLFPDGSIRPGRLFYVFLPLLVTFMGFFVLLLAGEFLPQLEVLVQDVATVTGVGSVLILPLFFIVIAAQVYRYLRLSTSSERDKTKWFVFSLLAYLALSLLSDFINTFPEEVNTLAFTVIPVGIGIGILRHNLWDIDLLIRRTLIYSVLTVSLGVIYLGAVIVLQSLLGGLTGQLQLEIVTVISTLTIAALFTPLRRRIQDFIDRRFYRRKYDTERVLAAFARRARDEVELDTLTAELVDLVQETMQPQMVSLWFQRSSTRPSP